MEKEFSRRIFTSGLLLSATGFAGVGPSAFAATYPSKLIKVVVPFTSGGGTDVIGRSLIQLMSEDLGQSMIIDNKRPTPSP